MVKATGNHNKKVGQKKIWKALVGKKNQLRKIFFPHKSSPKNKQIIPAQS